MNKHQPHLLVLPEDDANRQIANGFRLELALELARSIQVLPVAGGRDKVLGQFLSDHGASMGKYPERRMVLLIDCDGKPEKLQNVMNQIPPELRERVFVLGALRNPEELKQELKKNELDSYETIGTALAEDCRTGTNKVWQHPFLVHNNGELDRLRQNVRPILFP